MPSKILAVLGLSCFLVAATTFAIVERWLKSRIFTPLDQSVTLDDPHLRPPPFEVNLHETYLVSLDLDSSVDDAYEDHRCNVRAIEGSQWRVYRLGRAGTGSRELAAKSGERSAPYYFYPDSFSASPGMYQLEWDNPAAAACLNPRHPRLSLWTGPYEYRENAGLTQIFCVFLGGTGLALLVIVYRGLWLVARATWPRIFPGMVLRQVIPVVRHAQIPVISHMPHWGLMWCSVLMILMVLYMANDRATPKGMPVSWRKARAMVSATNPWPDSLEVYIRTPARFFVNREEVRPDELRSKLLQQLGRRMEWTVYVEADVDTNFGDTLHAIDVIRSCGANVSWITPKMREEWEARAKATAAK